MARWKAGEAEIDAMIADGTLSVVKADRTLADLMIDEARRHIASSQATAALDPTGSFALAYDASRKALAGILENQGLRATTRGGHRAVEDAVRAQLVPPMNSELNTFGWMRKLRNATEYPSNDSPMANSGDSETARRYAQTLIEMAEKVLDAMGPYRQ